MLKTNLIRNAIFSFDLFGQPPQFRIKNTVKFSTYFGVFFTLLIAILTLTYLIIESIDMLQYINPSVVSAQIQVKETPAYSLLSENFTLAVTVGNLQMASLKTINKHFTINMKNCIRERITNPSTNVTKVNSNCTDIPMETCTIDNFITDISQDTFKSVSFGTVQCIQKDYLKSNAPVLQGAFSALVHQYLLITLEACVNTTTKHDCSPKEEIQKGMEAGYYHVYHTDNLIRMNYPGKPFEELINQFSTTFSIYSSKQIYHNYMIAEAKSDVGLVGSQYEIQQALVQAGQREAQEFYNENYIVQHVISLDYRKTQYNRSYTKLQTILGKVGGFWSVLLILFTIIIRPLTNKLMNISIVNDLFHFKNYIEYDQMIQNIKRSGNQQSGDSAKILKKEVFKQSQDLSQNRLIQSLQLDKNKKIELSTIEQNKDFLEYLNNKDKKLKLSNLEILKSLFGCKTTGIKQLEYAEQEFQSKLNIVYIIKKLNEIEKLKCLLLTDNQRNMFNFIKQPTISTQQPQYLKNINLESNREQQINGKLYMFQDDQPILVKFWSAFSAYQQIATQKKFSLIDNQLLQYLDDNTQQLFSYLMKNQVNIEKSYDQELGALSRDYNIPDELISDRQNVQNNNDY